MLNKTIVAAAVAGLVVAAFASTTASARSLGPHIGHISTPMHAGVRVSPSTRDIHPNSGIKIRSGMHVSKEVRDAISDAISRGSQRRPYHPPKRKIHVSKEVRDAIAHEIGRGSHARPYHPPKGK